MAERTGPLNSPLKSITYCIVTSRIPPQTPTIPTFCTKFCTNSTERWHERPLSPLL
jgi:hypothetical protein